jgi:hypothetical protein
VPDRALRPRFWTISTHRTIWNVATAPHVLWARVRAPGRCPIRSDVLLLCTDSDSRGRDETRRAAGQDGHAVPRQDAGKGWTRARGCSSSKASAWRASTDTRPFAEERVSAEQTTRHL